MKKIFERIKRIVSRIIRFFKRLKERTRPPELISYGYCAHCGRELPTAELVQKSSGRRDRPDSGGIFYYRLCQKFCLTLNPAFHHMEFERNLTPHYFWVDCEGNLYETCEIIPGNGEARDDNFIIPPP